MTERVQATIKFEMPEKWLNSQHPVGAAIQGLYTELAKAYLKYNEGQDFEHAPWAEWEETYEDVED